MSDQRHEFTRPSSSQIELIPWDPDSTVHRGRLFEQRRQCGWKWEAVNSIWPTKQRDSRMNLQWVVISKADSGYDSKMAAHLTRYPEERLELVDTATSLGGKSREPDLSRKFIPVGHISLNTQYEEPGLVDPAEGTYFISDFYISRAVQSAGLGRAAMDLAEHTATSEPLCAKVLCLSTVAKDYDVKDARWKALGRVPPTVQNQDWYARRGYQVFKRVEDLWSEPDPTGKIWTFAAVFMKKDVW